MRTVFFILVFTGIATAQTIDPDFYNQTWYLYEVFDSDFNETFTVQGYQPYGGDPQIDQIEPSIFISDTFAFNGVGICNTINGTLETDPANNSLRTVTTNQTSNNCGFFEDMDEPYLFGPFAVVDPDPMLFTIVNPTLTDDGDGFQTMQFTTQPFLQYTFRNTPVLGLEAPIKNTISVFPNPANEILFVSTENEFVDNIKVFTTTGMLVSEIAPMVSNPTVPLETITAGVFFVMISAGNKTETFKIIKR